MQYWSSFRLVYRNAMCISMSHIKKVVAVALVLFATQFWLGSYLMLAAFLLSSLYTIPILAIISLFFWKKILGQIIPNYAANVMENFAGLGCFYQSTLLVAFLYMKYLKAIFVPTTFFILIAFINMKFAFFAAFFLAILAAKQVNLKEIGLLRYLPYVGVVLGACFLWGVAATLPPSEYEIGAVQLAVQQADGNVVCNQWGYGHLIAFFGGNPSDKAGGKQQCTACQDCIILTFEDQPNCKLLRGDLNVFNQIKVFKC